MQGIDPVSLMLGNRGHQMQLPYPKTIYRLFSILFSITEYRQCNCDFHINVIVAAQSAKMDSYFPKCDVWFSQVLYLRNEVCFENFKVFPQQFALPSSAATRHTLALVRRCAVGTRITDGENDSSHLHTLGSTYIPTLRWVQNVSPEQHCIKNRLHYEK